jgi:hypothetical protein
MNRARIVIGYVLIGVGAWVGMDAVRELWGPAAEKLVACIILVAAGALLYHDGRVR